MRFFSCLCYFLGSTHQSVEAFQSSILSTGEAKSPEKIQIAHLRWMPSTQCGRERRVSTFNHPYCVFYVQQRDWTTVSTKTNALRSVVYECVDRARAICTVWTASHTSPNVFICMDDVCRNTAIATQVAAVADALGNSSVASCFLKFTNSCLTLIYVLSASSGIFPLNINFMRLVFVAVSAENLPEIASWNHL